MRFDCGSRSLAPTIVITRAHARRFARDRQEALDRRQGSPPQSSSGRSRGNARWCWWTAVQE
jgi:hypothetical protein